MSPYNLNAVKVLVVDDEETYRRRLRLFLRQRGATVRTAADAHRALTLVTQFQPDVLIVDWMLMSSVDGLELSVRLSASNPDLQTIFITGYLSAELEERVSTMPNTCLLSKPFQSEALVELVHRLGRPRANGDLTG